MSAAAAVLANGTLLHAFDVDDTHAGGLVHATAAVLPPAFAVGEQTGADGAAVLRAAIAGYEVVCRIASAPQSSSPSLLMGSSTAVMVNAVGIACSAAGGPLEFLTTGSSTKRCIRERPHRTEF